MKTKVPNKFSMNWLTGSALNDQKFESKTLKTEEARGHRARAVSNIEDL